MEGATARGNRARREGSSRKPWGRQEEAEGAEKRMQQGTAEGSRKYHRDKDLGAGTETGLSFGGRDLAGFL